MHGHPCELEHGAGECARDEHVECADTVRHGVGKEAAKDGRCVEDGNEVKRKRRAGGGFEVSVGCDVKEGDIEAQETKEKSSCAQHKGRLA